jgi:uncharacterized protein YbjT (DUF2867 family)
MLQESWTGRRVIELEGPSRPSPNDVAAAFTRVLGHPVRMEVEPREGWEALFRAQGMRNPTPRARMLDGFNQGWIEFEGTALRGTTSIETVLADLAARG